MMLRCPACARDADGQDTCGQCSTDLSLLRLLAELPEETAAVVPPPARSGLHPAGVLLGGLVLGASLTLAWFQPSGTSSMAVNREPVPVQAGPTALPSAVPSPASGGFHYRVRRGDSLWLIAARLYGDGELWPRLLDRNPKLHPQRLTVGSVVVVPDLLEERP